MSFFKKFLNKASNSQESELEEAIKKDNLKKVSSLLDIKDINKEDDNFRTPIDFALNYSSLNVAKYLIDNGAKLEETIDGNSIISHLIKMNAKLDMLEYMYSKGASTKVEYGKNPIEMAIEYTSSIETFKFIFENFGINRDEGKRYILHDIVDSEKFELKDKVKLLELLINEYDLDINECENDLHVSSRVFNKRDFELLVELIKLGASVNSIAKNLSKFLNEKKIKELSSYIIKYPSNEPKYFLEILDNKVFEEYISTLDTAKDKGIIQAITKNTFLHDRQKVPLVKLALQKGADINELSNDDHPVNPLLTFTYNYDIGKNTYYLDFLIDNGASLESGGQSALFNAILDNDVPFVKHLLKKGANVNFVNYFENTAMNLVIYPKASFKNVDEQIEMLKILLEHGLDLSIPMSHYKDSSSNHTPVLEAVIDVSESKLVEYILDNVPNIEVNERVIEYAITRDLDINLAKKIIAINPNVTFVNSAYCAVRDQYFDKGILETAIDAKKEELVNHIIDTYSNIKLYSDIYPFAMSAVYYNFDISTVKKLIEIEPDINRIYHIHKDDPWTQTIVHEMVRNYNKELNEEQRVELLELMIKKGADLSIPKTKVNAEKEFLDRNGLLISYAINNENFEEKFLSLLLENGFNPYEPKANLNESEMHSIINRFRIVTDEFCLKLLTFFEKKSYKVDFEHKNSFNTDIFLAACMMNRPKTLQWLINNGADVTTIGGFDNSPALHKAISNYSDNDPILRAKTVEILIDNSCDIEQIDTEQFTPLMSATNYGCFECVRVLLEKGANANFFNDEGYNAAHMAVLGDKAYDDEENSELVRAKILAALKDAGANLDESSKEVLPILHLAILEDKRQIFNTLLKLDMNLNVLDSNGRTPIMTAIAYGDMYYVNKLMNKDEIRLDIIDSNNESIHFSAVMRGDENSKKILKYFLSQDLTIGEGREGFSLLHVLAYYANANVFSLVKDLFDDMNIKDSQGFTPLHWAAYSNLDLPQEDRVKIIQGLVENNANINERLANGENALALAVYAGFVDVANELINQGCDIQVALNSIKEVEGISPDAIAYLESRL